MRTLRVLIGSGAVAAVSLLTVPTLAAASTLSDTFAGIETGTPTPCGDSDSSVLPSDNSSSPFAGVASGTLNGTFIAAICHPAVVAMPGQYTDIDGGSFVLTGFSGPTLSGNFSSNASAIKAGFPSHYAFFFCKQSFSVYDTLVNDAGTPVGTLAAVLTHYTTVYSSTLGCTGAVFFATVSGTVTISS